MKSLKYENDIHEKNNMFPVRPLIGQYPCLESRYPNLEIFSIFSISDDNF